MKKLINETKNKLSNNKKNVQRVTAWAFFGASMMNFMDNPSSASVLGLIAGASFFLDVVLIKEKKKKML